MAYKNTEIEIKLPVDKELFSEIRNRLNRDTKFVKKSQQKDTYFTPSHRNFLDPEIPFEWFSIRKRGDKTISNYKHWYIDIYIDTTSLKIKQEIQKSYDLLSIKIGKFNSDDLLIKEIIKNHAIIKGTEEFYEKIKFFE